GRRPRPFPWTCRDYGIPAKKTRPQQPTAQMLSMIASPSLGLLWFVEPPLSDQDRASNVVAERGDSQPESAPRQHQRRPAQHQGADRQELRDGRGLAERAGPEVVAQPVAQRR